MRLRCVLIFALLLGSPTAAQEDAPAEALRGFLGAVARHRYGEAWGMPTSGSRRAIAAAVAKEVGADPAAVEEAFGKDAAELRMGFWNSFRTQSKAEEYAASGTFATTARLEAEAVVSLAHPGYVPVQVRMFVEDGAWKVGWAESFFPGGIEVPEGDLG